MNQRVGEATRLPVRQRCPDRRPDGADRGVGGSECHLDGRESALDGTGRSVGSEARPTTQDAGQFEPAAVEGAEVVAALRTKAQGQAASRRMPPASSRPDPSARRAGAVLPSLWGRRVGGGAELLRDLRPCRDPQAKQLQITKANALTFVYDKNAAKGTPISAVSEIDDDVQHLLKFDQRVALLVPG